MRILIAEDSRTQAVDLRRKLESLGHEVTVAYDGKQAWEHLQAKPVPVAILDWIMPEMNGIDLCRTVRGEKNLPYVYLILLTSKAHRHERLQGLSAGADEFLSKPLDTFELEVSLKTAQRIIAVMEGLATRIRELEQANEQLSLRFLQDEQTGLVNLRGFQEALTQSFPSGGRRSASPLVDPAGAGSSSPGLFRDGTGERVGVLDGAGEPAPRSQTRLRRPGAGRRARLCHDPAGRVRRRCARGGRLPARRACLPVRTKGLRSRRASRWWPRPPSAAPPRASRSSTRRNGPSPRPSAEGGNRLLLVEPTLADAWALSPV